ncbi:helical backbone metal receptor [Undibacterium pigrum]|uniref:Substrate-binding family protein n=1 Tax=Undibacterium pigrum TaxID=401470 RepID=A0A318ITF1_9BURK|nr:helical backbone metal receptor [Undibacterium pigrum]PXX38645.1 substrate-binding family protein [Undibacterium pigrum]
MSMLVDSLVDALGKQHQPCAAKDEPRIVSLVPSITELLCELGLARYLVGRTGFCIHPKSVVQAIPKIGGTKDVNIEKIRQLAPTHLIVNIDENEKPTVETLAQFVPHVIVTHPLVPRDNLDLYQLLGGIFGVQERAQELCSQFEAAYAALSPAMASSPAHTQQVVYCIWQDPWMTVSRDTYIAAMLALIGWQTWSPSNSILRYPGFQWSSAIQHPIDRVLLSTEPYRFTETHVDALEKQLGLPVQLVDGEMLSWYGSRAIAGLQYLKQLSAQ